MKVLVVSHEASRSGAPRVAELVVSCLVDQGHDVRVLSQRPGPLLDDFAALAPTRVHPAWWLRARAWLTALPVARRLALLDQLVALVTIVRSGCDLVYLNTSSTTHYLRPALWLRKRVVLHVHESRQVCADLMERCGAGRLADVPESVALVACSPSVEDDLLSAGARPGSVHLLLSVPDSRRVLDAAVDVPDGVDRVGVGRVGVGRLVVGACASVETRKGIDLWLEVARLCRERLGDTVVFRWVGGGSLPPGCEVGPGVELVGGVPDPNRWMTGFDVMTLPSRDDPFPLVVIEAMLLGRPVVAFDVGGVGRQLGGAGVLVPPEDVDAFADAVCRLLADASERRALGLRAAARAREEFSTPAFGRRLAQVVEAASAQRRRGAPRALAEGHRGPGAPVRGQVGSGGAAQQP